VARSWPRRALLVALVALAAMPASGTASGAPPRAAAAVLTTGTRIQWTGVTGMRLTLPSEVRLPEYAARLTLRGGTFAAVRWRYTGACYDGPCSHSGRIEYSRGIAQRFYAGASPGTDHVTTITDDGRLAAGVWDLYLFTDGAATLVFDQTGLPARPRAWTASGRVKGSFRALPTTCGYDGCTAGAGYAGRVRAGGATGDVGRLGAANVVVAHYSRHSLPILNSHGARGCAYRQSPDDTGDAASDHPYGCDLDEGNVAWPYNYVAFGSPTNGGVIVGNALHRTSGRVYLGFVTSSAHDVSLPTVEAWGVWYEYGVR
jgi:hypothetical protein